MAFHAPSVALGRREAGAQSKELCPHKTLIFRLKSWTARIIPIAKRHQGTVSPTPLCRFSGGLQPPVERRCATSTSPDFSDLGLGGSVSPQPPRAVWVRAKPRRAIIRLRSTGVALGYMFMPQTRTHFMRAHAHNAWHCIWLHSGPDRARPGKKLKLTSTSA